MEQLKPAVCENCKKEVSVGLRKQVYSNGAVAVFYVCLASDPPHRLLKNGSSISHERARMYGFDINAIPLFASVHLYIDCAVFGCQNPGVEDHHFAPSCVWGNEDNNWPRALLCKPHHDEWHKRMLLEYPPRYTGGAVQLKHISKVAEESKIEDILKDPDKNK